MTSRRLAIGTRSLVGEAWLSAVGWYWKAGDGQLFPRESTRLHSSGLQSK